MSEGDHSAGTECQAKLDQQYKIVSVLAAALGASDVDPVSIIATGFAQKNSAKRFKCLGCPALGRIGCSI